jgi:hypothetical protein
MVTASKFQSFIPPSENGDHLSRVEFEHRYQAMPDESMGDMPTVLSVLQQGLDSPEHQGLV